MRTSLLFATITLLGVAMATPAVAADREPGSDRQQAGAARGNDGFDHGMRAIPHNTAPGERAHGWQYFSDPGAHRAVVISPQGDYYLSKGKGLHWVAGVQTQD